MPSLRSTALPSESHPQHHDWASSSHAESRGTAAPTAQSLPEAPCRASTQRLFPCQHQHRQGRAQGLSLPICEMGAMLKLSKD